MSALVEEEVVADPKMIVVAPGGSRTEVFLGLLTVIGRSPECDVCLNSAGIAEIHAIISQTTAGIIIKDCHATGKILVNGEPATESLLGDGDELELDRYKLLIKLPKDEGKLSDAQLQQDLIQQMARRISKMEARRKVLVTRAWRLRQSLPRGEGDPQTELVAARKRITELMAELEGEKDFERAPTLGVEGASEIVELRGEIEKARKKHAEEVGLAADRIRTLTSQLDSLRQRLDMQSTGSSSDDLLGVQNENERLKERIAELERASAENQATESLQAYEQQLNEFRDQLAADADALQQRETEAGEREKEIQIGEEQLQLRIAETEKELASERAKIKREQSQIERMLAEARVELADLQREAETIERDERLERLRSQLRSQVRGASEEPIKLSDKIGRFLKGLGGK